MLELNPVSIECQIPTAAHRISHKTAWLQQHSTSTATGSACANCTKPGAISSSDVINLSVNPMNWITEKGHGDVVCFQREEKVPGTGLRPAKI